MRKPKVMPDTIVPDHFPLKKEWEVGFDGHLILIAERGRTELLFRERGQNYHYMVGYWATVKGDDGPEGEFHSIGSRMMDPKLGSGVEVMEALRLGQKMSDLLHELNRKPKYNG